MRHIANFRAVGVALLAVCLVPLASAQDTLPTLHDYTVRHLGNVNYRALREASGIAQSTRDKNVLWSHNDSGYGPFLFAFTTSGQHVARVFVEDVSARDWEDIAAFRWRDQSWLAIADTGDNAAVRSVSAVHIIAEPVITTVSGRAVARVPVERSISFTFPDGPADCESVAVDVRQQKIYLLTKRQKPPRLYSLSLVQDGAPKEIVQAHLEGEVSGIPRLSAQDIIDRPSLGLHGSQPTAMDFASDRSFAVINTYGYAYRFERKAGQEWLAALNSVPQRIKLPLLKQGEAVAIASDNGGFFVTSEGANPPLFYLSPVVGTGQQAAKMP